jgi:hypothetical protein
MPDPQQITAPHGVSDLIRAFEKCLDEIKESSNRT